MVTIKLQSASTQQEPEDVAFDHTVDKKLHQGDVDSQNNLSINNDNANVRKQLRTPTSQKKPRAKSSKHGESDLVKSFPISPAASNDTEGTPQIANRYRPAVRKISRKSYEQANAKSKNESRKVDSGSIFNNAIGDESDDAMDTRGEKAALETSDNSSTSGGSGQNLKEIVSHGMGTNCRTFLLIAVALGYVCINSFLETENWSFFLQTSTFLSFI
jgi:hypothetical protein